MQDTSTIKTNIKNLLNNYNIDAFIFSTTDEYINEYTPDHLKRLSFITNFTGSLALCILGKENNVIFVDGRYTLQAKMEVNTELFEIKPYTLAEITLWITKNLTTDAKIAINTRCTSNKEAKVYYNLCTKTNMNLTYINHHLVDELWHNQPAVVYHKIYIQKEEHQDQSTIHKTQIVSHQLKEKKIDYCIITSLDSIAWILNARGADINFNPMFFAILVVDSNEQLHLFLNKQQVDCQTTDVMLYLKSVATIHNDADFSQFMIALNNNKQIFATTESSPIYYHQFLKANNMNALLIEDPTILLKSIKTPKAILNMQNCHIRDGLYLTKLIYLLSNNLHNNYTELTINEELSKIKAQDPLFIGASFDSIVGINGNGAIIHYRASEKTNKNLTKEDVVLIDCGSQYTDGTTDITRVLSFASVSEEFKNHYTLVLKGHINLASAIFPQGTLGGNLDALARQSLWRNGLNYNHGTGHGVGYALSVHEGPISISSLNNQELLEGMVISNEPGFYLDNNYGIRLENLYVVTKSIYPNFLQLESLSLAPFDVKNINFALLNKEEKIWIEKYHQKVYNILANYLTLEEKSWLKSYMNLT